MTNRYNMVINILFWVLVSVLISIAVIIVLSQNDHIDSFLVKTETEIVIEDLINERTWNFKSEDTHSVDDLKDAFRLVHREPFHEFMKEKFNL